MATAARPRAVPERATRATRAARASRLRRQRWRPRGPWTLFALIVAGLAASLLFQGYARHDVGRSATYDLDHSAVVGLPGAGPIVDLSGRAVRSVQPPAGEIALTFDDGPDPTWTPRILAVLRRHHVPATFFVIGSEALAHPALVREELALGDVGSHTFTHADLGQAAGVRDSFELSLTQAALAGTGGDRDGAPPPAVLLHGRRPDRRPVPGGAGRGALRLPPRLRHPGQ